MEWIDPQFYYQLVQDGFIQFDGEAYVPDTVLKGKLSPEDAKKIHVGRHYVWMLFWMARRDKKNSLYGLEEE
jgi:hypothetical protein